MKDNTKIDIKEIGLQSAHFNHLAYDTDMGVQL